MSELAERISTDPPTVTVSPRVGNERTERTNRHDLEIIAPPKPTIVTAEPSDEAVVEAPAKRQLARGRAALLVATTVVVLGFASAVLTNYPDVRGDISIASKILGYPATDLPLIVQGTGIRKFRVSLPTQPVIHQFEVPIERVPWTVETDVMSPFTEIHFDMVNERNFVGIRQVTKYGGWEVFKRSEGVDSRLGWVSAGTRDHRPLVIVRTATTLTVMLGDDLAAEVSLPTPSEQTTEEMISTQAAPALTYFDVRQAR